MKKRNVILTMLFLALAVLFGVYDLSISKAFVDPADPFARFMELFGECTTPVLGLLSFAVLFFYAGEGGTARRKWVCRSLCFLGGTGMAAYLLFTLPGYFDIALWSPAVLLGSGAVTGLIFLAVSFVPREWRGKYAYVAAVCVVTILMGLVIVETLKVTFGRVRFREMKAPYREFTRWFVPNGITGSRSFPSGHTAHAAALFSLLAFCDYPEHRGKEPFLTFFFAAWTLLMALARVRIGAHFASDVLFGGTLMALTAFVVRKKLRGKWMRK